MDGTELLKLIPNAIGFFTIGDYPGVILADHQGWLFEGGRINPRPITRDEVRKRGGTPALADEVAELLGSQPGALDFLKKA